MAVTLFAGLSVGFGLMAMSREDERATQILNGKIENVRLCKWTDLTDPRYQVISFQERYDPIGASTNAGGALYTGTIISSPPAIPAPYMNDMRLITVQIQWTNFSGKKPLIRQRQMQTLVARYGSRNDPLDPSR